MIAGRVKREPLASGLSISESVSVSGPGRWTYVSGRVPVDGAGTVTEGPFRAQAESVFDQLGEALDRAGARLEDVIKLTVFLTDLAGLNDVNAVRAERFGAMLPASSAVQVSGLYGGAQLEIEAVAFTVEASSAGESR